uniref:PQ-loop repeat-containing protein n=1 Tax=Chromera velia CCMP2878 TaxID=1169474 RepID=A0A0G4FJC0_9ALVE|eukprot:Cvel_17344.t1-p1 / transcript=Cvel_17344.t1 / gene=Cvel_17344 / organism=Chromera_velia_CCMP2878 / gene_product=Mannose-P-dolichol utilization defect 1 protein, putative / transcript_product=Mannose-P-dolichol utilization defect 1 protein, putative / location=Cvel_scaffold1378:26584-29533(-) / protein_length=413 / sequence_SO=supercontig / SO=protein_coding / is_pseudo=false
MMSVSRQAAVVLLLLSCVQPYVLRRSHLLSEVTTSNRSGRSRGRSALWSSGRRTLETAEAEGEGEGGTESSEDALTMAGDFTVPLPSETKEGEVNKSSLLGFLVSNLSLSSIFSIMIFMGSVIVKLPQIFVLVKQRNVVGLSESALLIDAFAGALYTSYNFLARHPFSTWGEMAVITVQSSFLILAYWWFDRPLRHAADEASKAAGGDISPVGVSKSQLQQKAFRLALRRTATAAIAVASAVVVLTRSVPARLIPVIGILPTPIGIIGRLPQIWANFRQGHTGQLSLISTGLTEVGNVMRLYTTLMIVGDPLVLWGHGSAAFMNGILLAQIAWYWKQTCAVVESEKRRVSQLDETVEGVVHKDGEKRETSLKSGSTAAASYSDMEKGGGAGVSGSSAIDAEEEKASEKPEESS